MSIESLMPPNHFILYCPLQLRHQSSQWIFRVDFLSAWSSYCPKDSQESSPTPQFERINSSSLSLFTVQLSCPYMTVGKIRALTIWTSVDKVMSLLFTMLPRSIIAFLLRSAFWFHGWSHCPQWFWSPRKYLSLFSFFPHLFAMKWWHQMLWS